ncbi:M96 mating-specific protein family [Phytophthora cinnamomi]|uniref:M96 mating-specific protein family n=1 Tax=Phytophthora cinnamomi TaxID=4785 RepID=UPI003559E1F5|nr:M96 mating-specific protein family [Phytophthora cinnamomi]
MAVSLEDEDARAFQAALSFVDECVLDEEVEDAAALRTTALMQREDEWAAMSCGLAPTVNITGVEASFGALGSYETTPTVSAVAAKAQNSGASNRDKLRRRTETNERKKLLRKAGIYGDANWMSKDSRLEIAYLHERIEKLQLDLQVLQSRKTRQPALQTEAQEPTDDAMDSALQIPKVWEDIAIRQQRRLKAAERENFRLKLAVQHQQKVANCMTNLVRKRAGNLTNDCATFMNVDFSNQQIVRVLSSHGATEATWDHFKGGEKHLGNGNIYQKTAKNLDDPYTILEEFTKEMHSKNARADIQVQQLVRRYMEPDRDIVIWVSIAEPTEIKHKKLRGLTYHLRGYAMTKRSPASTPEHEVSQLQCVSLISLEPEAEAMYGPETVRAVTNFLIVTAAQKMIAHQDRIENALVDQQLRRQGVVVPPE